MINDEWIQAQDTKEDKESKLQWELPNFVITFWECVEAHGESYNSHTEANPDIGNKLSVEVEDNDLIIFLGSSATQLTIIKYGKLME